MEIIKTLSFGANSAKFEAEVVGENIVIIMGPMKQTMMKFKLSDVDKITSYFKNKEWFRFDGSMERTVPGGLRHFFETELKRPPKLASHVAAWMVHKGLLEHRYAGSRNVVEFRVPKLSKEGNLMVTPYQLKEPKDFQRCVAVDIQVFVHSIEDINGPVIEVGLITDWNPLRDTVYVNNTAYNQSEYVFLTEGD